MHPNSDKGEEKISVGLVEQISGHPMKTLEKEDSQVKMPGFKGNIEFGLPGKGLVGVKVGKRRDPGLRNHMTKSEAVLSIHHRSLRFDRAGGIESTESCKADLGEPAKFIVIATVGP